jgi:hypothetical protein
MVYCCGLAVILLHIICNIDFNGLRDQVKEMSAYTTDLKY